MCRRVSLEDAQESREEEKRFPNPCKSWLHAGHAAFVIMEHGGAPGVTHITGIRWCHSVGQNSNPEIRFCLNGMLDTAIRVYTCNTQPLGSNRSATPCPLQCCPGPLK